MKIDIDQHNNLRLREVFSGVLMETTEGNQIGVCMRDDTLEINVCPGSKNTDNWWRVNMQTGRIENMREAAPVPVPAETGCSTCLPNAVNQRGAIDATLD